MQHYLADLTSRSLRGEIRRGTFIVPDEVTWIIKRYSPDPTSGSLRRADLTSRSLRKADATSASLRMPAESHHPLAGPALPRRLSPRLSLWVLPLISTSTSRTPMRRIRPWVLPTWNVSFSESFIVLSSRRE